VGGDHRPAGLEHVIHALQQPDLAHAGIEHGHKPFTGARVRRTAAEDGYDWFRLLRPRGRFLAFDPNRMNPFMWLYRDRTSPFYSPLGVTPNERPVLAGEVATVFERTGFEVSSHYLSGLSYRYVASSRARLFLPIYNFIDSAVFGLAFMERLRPFVLTPGTKRPGSISGKS